MSCILHIGEVREADACRVGGKACSLGRLGRQGLPIPDTLCVTTAAYEAFVHGTGLDERLALELGRKDFGEMRWEELWDASLRIRNLFARTPMPAELRDTLHAAVIEHFADRPVAVRSSGLGEDSATTSFAGLHDSYLNVAGAAAILEHVRLVWASLWSDRALLYRQELGLSVAESRMAVVVQELVRGRQSGIVFGRHPTDARLAMIEAVHGLNEGLVDGAVEPDRWTLERETGAILRHDAPTREHYVVVSPNGGTELVALPNERRRSPPLDETRVAAVFHAARRIETLFGEPQDVEWTFRDGTLILLQARPITSAAASGSGDERGWYLSLTRSFENLQALRTRIEQELIPAMNADAAELAAVELGPMPDGEFLEEVERRTEILAKWHGVYWDEFIPFAHGARLFGQVYNDVLRPDDPFEFIGLLGDSDMLSRRRNDRLLTMAAWLRDDPERLQAAERGDMDALGEEFGRQMQAFLSASGRTLEFAATGTDSKAGVLRVLAAMAGRKPGGDAPSHEDKAALAERFVESFPMEQRDHAADLLDLARASYRLRDDDNIVLGRVERQVEVAVGELRRRVAAQRGGEVLCTDPVALAAALRDPGRPLPEPEAQVAVTSGGDPRLKARQLVGQPAGPGIVTGSARVVAEPADLFEVREGEVLVCDAIDPNMTFVVPLASGIVERRGGMLIHGAIIAREYGLPCVTGVPDAIREIPPGATVTVDGYLGIVTVAHAGVSDRDG